MALIYHVAPEQTWFPAEGATPMRSVTTSPGQLKLHWQDAEADWAWTVVAVLLIPHRWAAYAAPTDWGWTAGQVRAHGQLLYYAEAKYLFPELANSDRLYKDAEYSEYSG